MEKKNKFLHRPRLHSLFCCGIDSSLFTIIAGTGYGKTRELLEFFKIKRTERIIWLSLNDYDNIITNFWQSFTKSVKICLPEAEEPLLQLGFPDSSGKFDNVLRILSKYIYSGSRVIFVADNYDMIKNQDVKLFFEYIVQAGLENFCLVIVSSIKSDMNIKGLADISSVFNMSTDELRFTDEEVKSLLTLYGIKLADDRLKKIIDHIDGCPLALNLFVQGYEESSDCDGCLRAVEVSLFDCMFEKKYFSSYSDSIKGLLLKLSFFRKFPVELLKQLSAEDFEHNNEIIRNNIFIDYCYDTGFFEFQRLYYDFLQTKHGEVPFEEIKIIYNQAGSCFWQKGMHQAAINYYFNAENYDMVVHVLLNLPRMKRSKDYSDNILAYLNAMPEEFVRNNILVDFIKGFFLLSNMKVDESYNVFSNIKSVLEKKDNLNEDEKKLFGELCLVLADVSLLRGTCDFLDLYKCAGSFLPNGSTIRVKNIFVLGNNDAFFLPDNENVTIDDMLDMVFAAVPYTENLTSGSGMGFEWLYAAEAAFLRYDLEKAKECSIKAINSAFKKDQHDIVCNSYFLLARIAVHEGDYEHAEKQVSKIMMYININGITELFDLRDCVVNWFNIMKGDIEKVSSWISFHNDSYYAKWPIDTGRNNLIYAMYLMFKEEFQAANEFLDKINEMFTQKRLWSLRITFYLMKMMCFFRLGNGERALVEFKKAYEMAYNNNIITPFSEYRKYMDVFLDYIKKIKNHGMDEQWLEEIRQRSFYFEKKFIRFRNEANNMTRIEVIPKNMLDKEQMEILRLLATGLKKTEIEENLELSSEILKDKIVSLCVKLGAINVTDAIRIAKIRKYI